jgi:hypothetical protein
METCIAILTNLQKISRNEDIPKYVESCNFYVLFETGVEETT